MNYCLGLVSGVIVAFASAIFAAVVQRSKEKRRKRREAKFDVYMRLLDVKSLYFWVTCAEVHGDDVERDLWDRLRREAWRIADRLREVDDIEELDDILCVLFADKYATSVERAQALDEVIELMSNRTNARYCRAMRQISRENMLRFGEDLGHVSNAPGRAWHP